MKKFYLIIDESGAKGKAKNEENSSQEFSVIVGLLIPEEDISIWKKNSQEVFKINIPEKFHITSLSKEEQNKFRGILYDIFLQNGINCFYEDIYVQCFNKSAFDDRELLHSKLFFSVFSKALYTLSLLKEFGNIKIIVISDRLNKGEIKAFEKEVQDFIKIMTNKEIKRDISSFNKKTNQVIKAQSLSKTVEKDDNFPEFENIDLEITTELSSLTFMEDILSNSVYYYLKKKENYPMLNTKQEIQKHLLINIVWGE